MYGPWSPAPSWSPQGVLCHPSCGYPVSGNSAAIDWAWIPFGCGEPCQTTVLAPGTGLADGQAALTAPNVYQPYPQGCSLPLVCPAGVGIADAQAMVAPSCFPAYCNSPAMYPADTAIADVQATQSWMSPCAQGLPSQMHNMCPSSIEMADGAAPATQSYVHQPCPAGILQPRSSSPLDNRVALLEQELHTVTKAQAEEKNKMQFVVDGLRGLLLRYNVPVEELDRVDRLISSVEGEPKCDTDIMSETTAATINRGNGATPPVTPSEDNGASMPHNSGSFAPAFSWNMGVEVRRLENMTCSSVDRWAWACLRRARPQVARSAIRRARETIESQGGYCRNLSALIQASVKRCY
ncbi:unnamed protein product [Symbiodinium pilosum]|uniref:Uncharacterized protein n=1 Tax=Symbiodinium pilosum TaxID=2952 RepID=A0A812XDR3_SYMPI|nr:unnamed protein product [Symbiodinium pilosum]